MNKSLMAAALAAALLLAPKRSEAKLFELWGSAMVGAATGNGETDRDFFNWAGGGATGVEVGLKVLFVSAYIDYLRFFGGDAGANLVGFNLGGDTAFDIAGGFGVVFRLAGTFYVGTLDSAVRNEGAASLVTSGEVETRGVGLRGGVGLRYTFLKIFSVGITPQIGYHYFFGGADEDVTESDRNSSGWDFQAMAYLRAGLGF